MRRKKQETFEEMVQRMDDNYARCEVRKKLRTLPPTHTFDHKTGKMTPIKK